MGTRADFYVGGVEMEWLGSIPFDGYPHGAPAGLVKATSEAEYRAGVEAVLQDRGTRPSQGWPWPWNDSWTTDYGFAVWPAVVSGSRVRV